MRLSTEACRRELHRIQVQQLGSEDPLKVAAESGRLGIWMGTLLDSSGPQSEKLEAGTALLTWLMDQAEERMNNR